MDTIKIEIEEGKTAEFFVLEETTVGGIDYFLVTEEEDGDGDAMILKDLSNKDDEEAVFEFVEDDAELKAVGDIFAKLLENADLV
ncbi:MAG: DUF1292 domain-containing protein [Lachnospiraceae bacterium]|nr:DUF1292 domain-containing protein [Lachnospiraceae bacterium]